MKKGWLALALALCGSISAEANPVIRTAAALREATCRASSVGKEFELEATVLSAPPEQKCSFIVADESGGVNLIDMRDTDTPCFKPGDRLRISGLIERRNSPHPKNPVLNANCKSVIVLEHGKPPDPIPITAADMDRPELLLRPVRISGILVNVRKDEIDPNFLQFIIDSSNRMIYAASYAKHFNNPLESLKGLVGATVAIDGILVTDFGTRIHYNRHLALPSENSIRMLRPPSDDLFHAPPIGDTSNLPPEAVTSLGRRRAVGRVLAVWDGDTLLLRTVQGNPMKVHLLTAPPVTGDFIETVGFVETDLFHDNLASAIWRPSPPSEMPAEEMVEVSAKDMLTDKSGRQKFKTEFHGKTIRLGGTVQGVSYDGQSSRRLIISSDGYTIPVDCGNALGRIDGIEIGSTVSATGICVVDTETWNRHSTLPQTRGLFVVVRSPDDIAVLARPPWWTPFKLMVVIGVLALLLVAILIWNASLRILSERRGHEMYRSQIARVKSELRIDERTRLAAELHDHLAQNLTAISYQIASAERSRAVDAEASARHLATADRMLGSCRTELRRCLWDLKSDALDEADVSRAIRKSVEPIADAASVQIDFRVPRAKLSDSALHATLSIVRELASNAVNHGHAKNIRISGDLAHGTLRFSVEDDGAGFCVADAPGLDEGHFGLDGVRERLRRHNGEMSIESTIGKGTKVSIAMKSRDDANAS